MGQIKELTCKCGYEKKLFTGIGRMGINEKMVRRIFTPEELKDFDNAKQNGSLNSFMIENVKAYCATCNDIFAISTLKYKTGAIEKTIRKNCPECGMGTADVSSCPKCGGLLEEKEVGHWD